MSFDALKSMPAFQINMDEFGYAYVIEYPLDSDEYGHSKVVIKTREGEVHVPGMFVAELVVALMQTKGNLVATAELISEDFPDMRDELRSLCNNDEA